ncbi:hypothetical protein ACFWIO_27605 [Streptomyces diastatochromogenes]|uniref:hypothetical protein n=1 Tax=Streptomyces diastatochromogenes TaxID=42236 RepID=UPI003667C429
MSSAALQGLPRTVLRLHRTALLVWAAVVAGLTGWLVYLNEVTAAATRRAERACAHTDVCIDSFDRFDYGTTVGWIGTLICYTFLAVAAFAGGALVGRELESGTARLAWTQGVTPVRWLTAKLALPAVAVTAGGLTLVLAFRWGWSAGEDLIPITHWYQSDIIVARGPLTVAYGLCALAVGALAALLLRRTLAALGAALAAMWLLNFLLTRNRADLWPAVTRTSGRSIELPDNAWRVNWGRNADGYFAVYHPASHFWPLQWVETGIVLAAAALTTAAAYAVLRRRAA